MEKEQVHLWYTQPARVWPHALPIGNGKLGAMIWGQVQLERWQLNEDSIWYGGPRDRNPTDALKHLPALRQLLDENRVVEAEKLAMRAFMGMPQSQRHYETLGQADLAFPHTEADTSRYRRWLDLETATAGVSYDVGDVTFTRETFSSPVWSPSTSGSSGRQEPHPTSGDRMRRSCPPKTLIQTCTWTR
jgi:alpha-L-fucosidase 2